MAKSKKKNKKVRPQQETQQEQQAEPQQKDDRIKVIREVVLLATAITQLLIAITTLVLVLIKDK